MKFKDSKVSAVASSADSDMSDDPAFDQELDLFKKKLDHDAFNKKSKKLIPNVTTEWIS